ncbi:cytosine permease [uncultured Pseudoteredinibacter sp.]|uniref:cytosine permease n=1 Tax=uncultured Pseudoteredinibacter sp. TaxID=1641701 RepID=UPI00263A3706|nr:cytosine permease [uncultured Pseudoteredinibacter sp.]
MQTVSGNTLAPIAPSDRDAGFVSLVLLWAGGNILLATFMVGSYYAEGLGFWPMVLISISANLFAYGICAISSQRGARYGLDEVVALRPAFGMKGAYYGAFVLIFINFGWIGLLSSMTGTAAVNASEVFLGESYSFSGNYTAYAVGGGLLIPMFLVMLTPKASFYLSTVTVPVLGGFSLYILYKIVNSDHMAAVTSFEPTGAVGIAFAVETCVVWAVAWQPYLGSWNKFASSERNAYWGTFVGLAFIGILFAITGGIATLATGEIDPAVWAVKLELGLVSMIIIILGTITTSSLLLYAGVMAFMSIFPKFNYKLSTAIVALPSLIFIYDAELQNLFGIILLFVGLLAGPYWAISIVDYMVLRKGMINVEACFQDRGIYRFYKGFNIYAFVAQALGMVVWLFLGGWLSGYALLSFSLGESAFSYISATIPSMLVAAVAYVVLVRLLQPKSAQLSESYE